MLVMPAQLQEEWGGEICMSRCSPGGGAVGRAQTPTLGKGGTGWQAGRLAGRGDATAGESSAQLRNSAQFRLQAEMRLEIGVLD